MKTVIIISLILLPAISFAQTVCRAVEHPDHLEAVCVGDEKASPVPDTQPSQASRRAEQMQQQPLASQADLTTQPQTAAAMTSLQTSATSATSQGAIVHRQGRQQYMKGMEEARAARLQLISTLQQGQPSP
jgi:hypothetical protein